MTIYLVIPPKLAVTLYFTFYDKYITIWHLCNAEHQQCCNSTTTTTTTTTI